MKLDNTVALITGAARGIGFGIAKRFVQAGGRVAIVDLDAKTASDAAASLGRKDRAIGLKVDVTSEEEVNAGVKSVVEAFGTIDTLALTPAFRSCIRSRNFPSPTGRSFWRSISMGHFSPPKR